MVRKSNPSNEESRYYSITLEQGGVSIDVVTVKATSENKAKSLARSMYEAKGYVIDGNAKLKVL